MKAVFTLIISVLGFGFSLFANPNEDAGYFICTFNESITSSEISQLEQQGFNIVNKDSTINVVYVTSSKAKANFSCQLKDKMKELIMVDGNGKRIYLVESSSYDSPDFLKLLFNFI